MKKLQLESSHYKYLVESYREHLRILGYAEKTVIAFPRHVQEFFFFLETHKITSITAVKQQDATGFYNYLLHRKNQSRKYSGTGSGLSSKHIQKILTAINGFSRYYHQLKGHALCWQMPSIQVGQSLSRAILDIGEIEDLFAACDEYNKYGGKALQQRDKAMLGIFYGCGLRRNEGIHLDVEDINLDRLELHVRQGKGRKERYIAIANGVAKHIEDYLYDGRYVYISKAETAAKSPAFFLNCYGERMLQGYENRLRRLLKRADIVKKVSLHSLRHSIATHLLAGGMPIVSIAQFLGHSSLESTQIYTHIVNDYTDGNRLVKDV